VARAPQQAPPAAPPAPQATDDQFWLDFTKTFDPMAPTTPAPTSGGLPDFQYRQTTYYTCVTYSMGGEHCGWHIPILEVSAADRLVAGLEKTVAVVSLVMILVALILA